MLKNKTLILSLILLSFILPTTTFATTLKEKLESSNVYTQITSPAMNGKFRRGMKNDYRINVIQTALRDAGYFYGNIDGSYGLKTQNAVKGFQRSQGLYADGIWGNTTLSKFQELLKTREQSNLQTGTTTPYGSAPTQTKQPKNSNQNSDDAVFQNIANIKAQKEQKRREQEIKEQERLRILADSQTKRTIIFARQGLSSDGVTPICGNERVDTLTVDNAVIDISGNTFSYINGSMIANNTSGDITASWTGCSDQGTAIFTLEPISLGRYGGEEFDKNEVSNVMLSGVARPKTISRTSDKNVTYTTRENTRLAFNGDVTPPGDYNLVASIFLPSTQVEVVKKIPIKIINSSVKPTKMCVIYDQKNQSSIKEIKVGTENTDLRNSYAGSVSFGWHCPVPMYVNGLTVDVVNNSGSGFIPEKLSFNSNSLPQVKVSIENIAPTGSSFSIINDQNQNILKGTKPRDFMSFSFYIKVPQTAPIGSTMTLSVNTTKLNVVDPMGIPLDFTKPLYEPFNQSAPILELSTGMTMKVN